MTELVFKSATAEDSAFVSGLAQRSKAHWGYDADFMLGCREELTYSPAHIQKSDFILFVVNEEVIGFYQLSPCEGGVFELRGLFIEPAHIGRGYGGALLKHAINRVAGLGGTELQLDADPNATEFYLHHGAVIIGESESGSIPGRMLPAMSISVPG